MSAEETRARRYPGLTLPWEAPPETGAAIEVAPGVLWLRLPLPMALDHVNIYALDDADGWTLIDAGIGTEKTVEIWEALLAGPLAGKPVARVLLTHHHPDHVGMAGWFQARGAEIITTRTAFLLTRMLQLDEQERPTPEMLAFWRACGMPEAIYERRSKERPFNFVDCTYPLALGYRRIAEGDEIRLAGRTWVVRMGSGHAPEHATLWSQDDNLVLGGDQLLPAISPNIGVHPTEPEGDPMGEWLESCARLRTHAHEDHLVLPGHKLPYRGLPRRLTALIENHHSALNRLEAHLAEPRSACDCFSPLFKRTIGDAEHGLATVEAMAHCLHLWHTGRVTRDVTEDGQWHFQARSGA